MNTPLANIGSLWDQIVVTESPPAPVSIPTRPASNGCLPTSTISTPASRIPRLVGFQSAQFHYFVDQGFLLYDDSQNVLLDRQILPFADFHRRTAQPDIAYFRSHILMQGLGPNSPGSIVLSQSSALDQQARLHASSHTSVSRCSSACGFLGDDLSIKPGISSTMAEWFSSFGNWSRFTLQPPDEVRRILPRFFVKAGRVTDQTIARFNLREMVDVTTGDISWFLPLSSSGAPMVFATDAPAARAQTQELWQKLWRLFAFNPVFVGMSSVGREDWKNVFPSRLPQSDPYVRRLRSKCRLSDLGTVTATHQMQADTVCFSCPEGLDRMPVSEQVEYRDWINSVLNGPATLTVSRLLGRSDVSVPSYNP